MSPYVERIKQHFLLEELEISEFDKLSTPKGTIEDLIAKSDVMPMKRIPYRLFGSRFMRK